MSIFGNIDIGEVRKVAVSDSRYRLVATRDGAMVALNALDVGKELSEAIIGMGFVFGKSDTPSRMEMAETAERMVRKHIFEDDVLGQTVILRNLGILFEPEIHIDVTGMLQRISRNTLTILLWPGEMDDQALYFLDRQSPFRILRKDINYTII